MASRIGAFRESAATQACNWVIGSIGAYFAYLRHPFEKLQSIQAARLLAGTPGLLCLPGSAFGPGQECFLRLAFANIDASQMPEITRRLGSCVQA